MLWLNAAALAGLAAVAAPVLIHLLVQRRAELFAFPTLRFLRPARLASVRRHVLDDLPLLLVRCLTVAAAAAAIAGPLIVTPARRASWDRRTVRAIVVAAGDQPPTPASGDAAFRGRPFTASSIVDGIHRATAWLEAAPPARRELLIRSPFPIGSLAPSDLVGVAPDVGIDLKRTPGLPATRTVPFSRLLTAGGAVDRELTLAGPTTTVRERAGAAPAEATRWPIEIVAAASARGAVDAAIAAVREQRVAAPAPQRLARLVFVDGEGIDVSNAVSANVPWIADAIARIARDDDLTDAAGGTTRGIAAVRFAAAPWRTLARAANGAPVVVAAALEQRLLVVTGAPPVSVVTPILLRAVANALGEVPDLRSAEVVPIADEDLRAWSRPSLSPPANRLAYLDEDDRRWWWGAVLLLLGIEAWMRRGSRRDAAAESEAARVA